MAIPGPIGLNSPQDIATALKFGPQTAQALQHSSYLAQALQQLNGEGSQNIHSGGELAAKLLASALLMRGYDKAQHATMGALQGDQAAQLAAAIRGTPLDPAFASPPPEVAPQAPSPTPEPVAAPPPPAQPPQGNAPDQGPQVPPQGSATPAAAYSPQDRDALTHMLAVEAGGEGPVGMAAAAHVALNRLKAGYGGAKSLSDVIYQPHQFEGIQRGAQASPQTMAGAQQVADQVLGGQAPDPTGGAMAFLNPELQTHLGRQIPAWAQGQGQRIGNHVFFGGGPQLAQNSAQPVGPSGPDPVDQGPSGVAPQFDPSTMGMGAQPFQQPAPQGSAPAPTPQAPIQTSQPPHNIVTPQEWKTAYAMAQDWHTRELGLSEIAKLKMRAAGIPEDPSKPYWGEDGRAHYAPGTESTITPGALPGSYKVTSPQNDLKVVSEPNLTGPPPAGYDRDPANPNHLILQGTGTAPPTGASGAPPPAGKAPIPPALQKTYMDTLNEWHKGPGYQDYTNSLNAANALETNLKASLGGGTIVDQTAVDAVIRAMTGLSARQNSVNSVLEHLPWSEQLKGFVAHAIGPDGANGYVTPKVVQAMRTAVHAYADGHRQLAQQEYDAYNGGANRMGFDLGQTLPTVLPQSPVKWLDGPPPPPASGQADYLQRLLAEKAKRTSAVGSGH